MRSNIVVIALLASVCAQFGCASESNQMVVSTYKTVFSQMPEAQEKSRTALLSAYPELTPDQIEAIYSVPRAVFVTEAARHRTYDDLALPIGSGQMTLKLSDIAFLLTRIPMRPTANVLEIGTGTGYFSAVLSRLVAKVYTVEWVEYLSEIARQWIDRLNIANVSIRTGDGIVGWERHAPYDAILVTASLKGIPKAYFDQLKPEGYLAIAIIEDVNLTQWHVYQKKGDELVEIATKNTPVSAMVVVDENVEYFDLESMEK